RRGALDSGPARLRKIHVYFTWKYICITASPFERREPPMIAKTSLLAACALVLLAATPSAAQTDARASSAVREHYSFDGQQIAAEPAVRMGDRDTASPEGARVRLERIRAAAERVCAGPQPAAAELACRAQAMHDAVVHAGSPALSDLAARETARR